MALWDMGCFQNMIVIFDEVFGYKQVVFMMYGAPISWCSKKSVVALSSMGVCQNLWLENLK